MTLSQQLHLQREINRERIKAANYTTKHSYHWAAIVATVGLWLPFYLIIGINNRKKRLLSQNRANGLEMGLSLEGFGL